MNDTPVEAHVNETRPTKESAAAGNNLYYGKGCHST